MGIGLILEGGGMRGVYTAGVLDFFLDKGILLDNCFGVSAGACHACSYLAGQRGRAFATAVDYLGDKRYCSLHSLITTGDMFGAEMLYETIPKELYPIDNASFLKNTAVFQAVVTNCETGKAEYPVIKDLLRDIGYVRASSSLPLVSRIVKIGGKPYLDGGIADSIPVRQSVLQGNLKNVVVLTRHRQYRKGENKLMPLLKMKYKAYPKLVESLQSRHIRYNETLEYIAGEEQKGNLFVIAPQEPLGLSRVEKNREKLQKAYETGYADARRSFSAVKGFIS